MAISLGWVNRRATSPPTQMLTNYEKQLPARFAGLTSHFAVILVGKSLATATTAAASIATAAPIAAGVPSRATSRSARAAAGFRLGARFVDLKIATAEVFSVERRDGFSGFRVVYHLDEAEAARFARLAIGSDVNARKLSEGFEQGAQIRCSRLKAHVANKKVLHTFSPEALRSTAARFRSLGRTDDLPGSGNGGETRPYQIK